MDEYEYVEINSIEELYEFIENATKEELILLRQDLEEAKRMLEDEDSGGGTIVLKRTR